MKKRRLLWVAMIVFLLLSLFVFQFLRKTQSKDQESSGRGNNRSAPLAVEVQPIRKDVILNIGEFTGTLNPHSKILIASKVSGRAENIFVNIGDQLENGQLLAELDDEEYVQQVVQAESELKVAKANVEESKNALENTRREYERTRILREKKIVSESQLDIIESDLKSQEAKLSVALAQLAQKESVLKATHIRLGYTRIRLPENLSTSRFVGERFVDEGALLSVNQPIVSVVDIEKLVAVIHVIERDYTKIRLGLPATITTDAFRGRKFTGKVIRIAPVIKESSRQAAVELEIPNEDLSLKPGMFVRVSIEFEKHENSTLIPVLSVVKRDDVEGIFLADKERKIAVFVPVTLGFSNESFAEVLSPSNLTGSVITLGHHLLENNMPIILSGDKTSPLNERKGKVVSEKIRKGSREEQKP